MTAVPVLIFAVGNESRGDDALGPLLLRELDAWLSSEDVGREKGQGFVEQFELIEDFQFQIEHAMDMKDRKLILFIDAGMDTRAPFAFYRLQANNEPVLYSHALAPEALLKVYAQFYHQVPPDTFVLCIKGESFELGEAPSPEALANLASALQFIKQRLLDADALAWDKI
ncbi:MAG: hydrogenase maturation protease [Proteobacteria bacterium]|nr:hydrogenase maturation protease [Pseudomonadota bacterium]